MGESGGSERIRLGTGQGASGEEAGSARAAVERAIQMDTNLPEAWTLLASLQFYREFDFAYKGTHFTYMGT